MKIKVKVTKLLPIRSGTSTKGNAWVSQSFIAQTFDEYPRSICFSIFNPDNADKKTPMIGDTVSVSFTLESRSFTAKDGSEMWSTNVNVKSITTCKDDAASASVPAGSSAVSSATVPTASAAGSPTISPQPDDDAPF